MTLAYPKDRWSEDMASRVRKAYIGKHITGAVLSVGMTCLLCVVLLMFQPKTAPSIGADMTAEFLSQQVEGTYSQVNVNGDLDRFWEL